MATNEKRESRDARIKRERVEMNVPPWGFAPSAVSLDGNPWQDCQSAIGYKTWKAAQQQRREIFARNSEYFWDDCDDLVPPDPKGK